MKILKSMNRIKNNFLVLRLTIYKADNSNNTGNGLVKVTLLL